MWQPVRSAANDRAGDVRSQIEGHGVEVPAGAELRRLLAPDGGGREGSLLQRFVSLLAWPAYRERMLEALVAGIGGVNVDLRERCADALVCLLRAPEHMAAPPSDALGASVLHSFRALVRARAWEHATLLRCSILRVGARRHGGGRPRRGSEDLQKRGRTQPLAMMRLRIAMRVSNSRGFSQAPNGA